MKRAFVVLILSILLPMTLTAHHSRSEFAKETIEIKGELLKVYWRNPHAGLDVQISGANGGQEVWRVETYGSPNLFSRMGVKREHFVVGEEVTIAGNVSNRRPKYMLGSNVLFENGMEAVLSATIEPRWSEDHVGGSDQSDVDLSQVVDAEREKLGIFRVWSIAGRTVGVKRHFPFTEFAREAMAAWDPVISPVAQCQEPGMPVPMYQPLSFVVADNGDTLRLQTEYFGTVRTIHMQGGDDPESQEASQLGYSVGRWDGSALVVETSRINYPYFSSGGAPMSENVKVSERFSLSEDQTELVYRLTVTDPLTFTEPAHYERLFVALGAPFVVLDCTLF
ncbi:MAG: DUF6152 family protein [Woeseiaceae bacterium]